MLRNEQRAATAGKEEAFRGRDYRTVQDRPGFNTRDSTGWPVHKKVILPLWNIERKTLRDQQESTGRALSHALRHSAIELHLKSMDSNGWVKWTEMRANCEFLRFKPKD